MLLSIAAACAQSSPAGAFLTLTPRFMTRTLPAALSPQPTYVGAAGRVGAIRSMRAAEGERELEALRVAGAPIIRTYPDRNFRSTWHDEGGAYHGVSSVLAVSLPKHVPVGRVVLATGYDVLSPYWGDLFWLNK